LILTPAATDFLTFPQKCLRAKEIGNRLKIGGETNNITDAESPATVSVYADAHFVLSDPYGIRAVERSTP
jgi:hypothetical protein